MEVVDPKAAAPQVTQAPPAAQAATPGVTQAAPVAAQAPVTPEKVEVQLPEGLQLSKERLAEYTGLWDDTKATAKERAQKLLDLSARWGKEDTEAFQKSLPEKRAALLSEQRTKNETTLKSDPDFKDWTSASADARRPLEQFAKPEEIKALTEEGLENHPVLARILRRIGNAMKEGQTVQARPASQANTDAQAGLRARFPKMFAEQDAKNGAAQ